MTAIEDLWKHAHTDKEHKRLNGSLLSQATYICPKCGHEKKAEDCQCMYCGNTECDDA